MGGVHFSRVHNIGVFALVVLLALFADYQGALRRSCGAEPRLDRESIEANGERRQL